MNILHDMLIDQLKQSPDFSQSEIDAIRKKAYTQVIQKKFYDYYQQQIEENPEFLTEKDSDIQLKYAIAKLSDRKDQLSSTHIFLTINPKEGVILQDLISKVEKCIKKKWITEFTYSYEQRSEEEATAGHGAHCHIVINRGTEPAKAKKELKNTFKDICNVDNPHCLNIQFRKGDGVTKAINYIKGTKADPAKQQKLKIDAIWRQQFALQPFYASV